MHASRRLLVVLALLLTGLAAAGAAPAGAEASPPMAAIVANPRGPGYWLVDRAGATTAVDGAIDLPDVGTPLRRPVVGATATLDGRGLWLVASDGGVFTLGDAPFLGSLGGTPLNQPIVGIVATPTGLGYWLVASDGGVFTFGDATFHGSTGAITLNRPVVAMASSSSGRGYSLIASDGGVFTFGDAPFLGSLGDVALRRPIVGAASDREGYWLVAADGGVFTFGDAPFLGARPDAVGPVVGMAAQDGGSRYWVAGIDGRVQGFAAGHVPDPPDPPPLVDVALTTEVVTDALTSPTAMARRPGHDDLLYVTERPGTVRLLRGGVLDPDPVLDLGALGPSTGQGERGLLGLAFSADGQVLHVDHTLPDGDVVVASYAMVADDVADPASRAERLRIEHSQFSNHNGGDLHLGPDGYLYVAVGDGGGAGNPLGTAQDLGSLLGKLLRLDVSGPTGYAVPPSNPFVGVAGARPEIWAYGLRNPWRFSFDAATGDLWIGDVGQGAWEEVDLEPAGSGGGRNYGWSAMEGSHPFQGGTAPDGAIAPIDEYAHADGDLSITGGLVYRGDAIAGLHGAYVFGDFGSGRIGALRQAGGVATEVAPRLATLARVVAFGTDGDDELLALTLTGELVRFVPA